MFNPFLIAYFILLATFFAGVFIILYHLLAYELNKRITVLVSSIFIVGSMILLTINVVLAIEIEWQEFTIIF